jgi:YVTN family beta-propeller protein
MGLISGTRGASVLACGLGAAVGCLVVGIGVGGSPPVRAALKPAAAKQPVYKSPTCVALSPDGKFAYVTNHTADTLAVIDTAARKVIAEITVGRGPTGLAAGPDGRLVYVANTGDHTVSVIDVKARKAVATVPCGYEPTGLVLSPDGKHLYTANYISDDVSVIGTAARKETGRIKVGRAPTYLAVTPDGKHLLVNNSLSHEPATKAKLTAHLSVIDTAAGKVVAEKRSPGTMLLGMGITVTADGKFALAVHSRPNFNITPSQLNQGWVHTNALSIIPLAPADAKVATVLLDNVGGGVANPHGVAVSKDGRLLYVSHRGTHQISIVDLPKLLYLLQPGRTPPATPPHVNLGFLWQTGDVVRRVSCGGMGPNGIAVSPTDGALYVTNYFSDQVAVLDPATGKVRTRISLGGPKEMTEVRRGEFLFHDATHCFQKWVSCTSCHPGVRADGVNWDLLNDGMTNPKNAKSLVGSDRTPPSMALGVRATMEVAVEKGFKFIQFITPKPGEVETVSAFLRSVPFIPSPFHRMADGRLDKQATRGQAVFKKAGCAGCHPAPLYTDLGMYDVGTFVARDYPERKPFDTPTLREMYRTAPYLHDGRAATLKEVVTTFNAGDGHGKTSNLSENDIDDLVAFLMAL